MREEEVARRAYCPSCDDIKPESRVGQTCFREFCWTQGVKYIRVRLLSNTNE